MTARTKKTLPPHMLGSSLGVMPGGQPVWCGANGNR